MACKTGVTDEGRPSTKIWLNCVGTFGITSASYHFTRLFGAVMRAGASLRGRPEMFELGYVDDILYLARGREAVVGIWLSLLFLYVAGTPFSWHKFGGGAWAQWIGFEIQLREGTLGMSEKRLRWARDWMEKILANKVVATEEFRSALGRLSFMMSAFEHLKPFSGPLYSWVCAVEHCPMLQVPAGVLMILHFLKRVMVEGVACTRIRPKSVGEEPDHWFRSDAKAEGEKIVLGGWCTADSKERAKCRWFSVELDRVTAPWAYEAGEPFRAIAALELLGTMVSVLAFSGKEGVQRFNLSAGTDNVGNRHVMSRLLTTKFPLCVVLMRLAWELHGRNIDLRLDWLPRLQNREADALTNSEFEGFDPKLRIHVGPGELVTGVFKELMDKGATLYKEVKELREKRKGRPKEGLTRAKKTKVSTLDPW